MQTGACSLLRKSQQHQALGIQPPHTSRGRPSHTLHMRVPRGGCGGLVVWTVRGSLGQAGALRSRMLWRQLCAADDAPVSQAQARGWVEGTFLVKEAWGMDWGGNV